eukprot:2000190-Prorocentrum_lima.AAC.1
MTSSLVGSEMCIRDRPREWATVAGPVGATESQGSGDPWAGTAGTDPWRCLLYTSDAADDM